jgi:hypothetical protein
MDNSQKGRIYIDMPYISVPNLFIDHTLEKVPPMAARPIMKSKRREELAASRGNSLMI